MAAVVDLNRLLAAFAERVPQVAHAAVVAAEGLPLAFSDGLSPERVDQLAAATSGLVSLVQGAARVFEGGPVAQAVVEMDRGVLIVMPLGRRATLAVLAAPDCDLGLVLYETALLAERTGCATPPWPAGGAGTPARGNGHDPA